MLRLSTQNYMTTMKTKMGYAGSVIYNKISCSMLEEMRTVATITQP